MKKQICRLTDNGLQPGFCACRHSHIIMDAQRDTETIKAGAEIGSARRNANGNVLHRSAVVLGAQRRFTMRECSDAPTNRQPIRCAMPIYKYVVKGLCDR